MAALTDYDVLERAAIHILTQAGLEFARALQAHLPADGLRGCLTDLLWTFASFGEGARLTCEMPNADVQCRLGLYSAGSASAFEDPFIAEEQVWFSGRLALHEYVHEAVDQVLARLLPDAH